MIIRVPKEWGACFTDRTSATNVLLVLASIVALGENRIPGFKSTIYMPAGFSNIYCKTTLAGLFIEINRYETEMIMKASRPDALEMFQRLSRLEDQNTLLLAEIAILKEQK